MSTDPDHQWTEGSSGGGPPRDEHPFLLLLRARYVAAIVVLMSLLHALVFFFLGVRVAVRAYWHAFGGGSQEVPVRPGLEVLHSLDFLLIGLVLVILALGVGKLFLMDPRRHRAPPLPSWLNIESFSQLKFLLWETILTALLIESLSVLTTGLFQQLDWSALILPVAILALALGLHFLRKE